MSVRDDPPRTGFSRTEASTRVAGRAAAALDAGRRMLVRFLSGLCDAGIVAGALFFAASLTPSLLPRSPLVQGVLSGLCLAAGYGLGVAGRRLWLYLQLPVPSRRWMRRIHLALLGACFLAVAIAAWLARPWQNAVRDVMGLPPLDGAHSLMLPLVALLVFVLLLAVVRLLRFVARRLTRRTRRWLPPRIANVVGVGSALLLFALVVNGMLVRGLLHLADASFRQADALIPPGDAPPASPTRTGSPESLVPWDRLGRAGRGFVASGPDATAIARFTGRDAATPIRTYVGLPAADSVQERARLALRELQRAGGFSRAALVVITPTGTGWVDPAAIDGLEYLHHGDIASVAMQYSYLSSPLSLMVEPEYGREASRALFDEIYGYWRTLPRDTRPKLYLHGLSLGAMNSEHAVDAFELLGDPVHGALWSGPPFPSPHWRHFTRTRNAGSPAWLPEYRNGRLVRFMNQHGSPVAADAPWGAMRIVYLQYASDAITFFDHRDAWRAPAWLAAPRGPDVSPALRWYPVVSMFQFAVDMMLADTAPMGYGHVFAPAHYIDAWLLVTGIEDWSGQDIERLKRKLDLERLQSLRAQGGED